jgi:hypothetical protein
MRSNTARIILLVVLVGVAVALFFILRDDGGDDGNDHEATVAKTTATQPTEPPVEVIEMRNGAPVGGVKELSYEKGDRVRIDVRLDEPQEDVHVHGYEIERLNPAKEASFDFPAKIEGVFELEAHGPDGDVLLAEITVSPS